MHLLIVVSSKTTWIENVQTLCREHHFRVPAVVTAIAPAETHFHHENFSTLILIMFLPSCQRRDISFQTKCPILTIGRNSFRTMLYSTNTYQFKSKVWNSSSFSLLSDLCYIKKWCACHRPLDCSRSTSMIGKETMNSQVLIIVNYGFTPLHVLMK